MLIGLKLVLNVLFLFLVVGLNYVPFLLLRDIVLKGKK